MQIGAQMYTLRMYAQNEADLARSLEKVARIGYRTVQLSGIGPIAPQRVKKLCDDNGLEIVLTHNSENDFLYNTDALIERHELYACRYVGLGAMADRYRSPEWVECFVEDFTPAAQKIKDAGMLFMYHNHGFEFAHMPDGRTMMDLLLEKMPADIMGVTADTYWLQYGGVDVNKWLAEHADRLACVHLKDWIPNGFDTPRMAAVGEGNIDFAAIVETLKNNGVTRYALVEQDDCYGRSPFDCLAKSYENLKKLGC
ncbi:MAG: sugar phosphate isomerase/epimerase [Oscillospiraceae bacterium]|jgi:sugar phosphate isomerase/epimerase|nr:sugar phosphate isomerase/epimerase [Oscillospiraceae bacterium]